MDLAWITDPHLNFLDREAIETFCRSVADSKPDTVLLGGDIGEAPNVCVYLNTLESLLDCPIYFVLGNHDFYRGTIGGVRANVERLCAISSKLVWLPNAGITALTEETALIGHDGWGDGRYGDYARSTVFLSDFVLILDLLDLGKESLLEQLHALGDEAAGHFRQLLPEALERFRHVIVLTHVPPFREACWHQGRISDDNWLPFFTCKAVGEVLREAMERRPDRQMTVLCGHTHGAGEAWILPNLHVITGGVEYGKPKVQRVVEV